MHCRNRALVSRSSDIEKLQHWGTEAFFSLAIGVRIWCRATPPSCGPRRSSPRLAATQVYPVSVPAQQWKSWINISYSSMDLYFSDVFNVKPLVLDRYGAFNVSLVADLPLFVDPFLVFNSRRPRYQHLHREIVRYLEFLYGKAQSQDLTAGLVGAWYRFPEIKQNWLGFSATGNLGRGLGPKFAKELYNNLGVLFHGLNEAHITKGVHLEKLCLVSDGVGRDNISDFTNNLIHGYLLDYTSTFAQKYIDKSLRRVVAAQKVRFNYNTETWELDRFDLPIHKGAHVLLTPRDLLTRDETWINKRDLFEDWDHIPEAIPNVELRQQINNYFRKLLPRRQKKPIKKEERQSAISATIREFPGLIDYYIKYKEDHGDQATRISDARVQASEQFYVRQVRDFVTFLRTHTQFYRTEPDSYDAAFKRAQFLKDAIENKGCHKIFYVNGQPIKRESDLHILYRLTWFGTAMDVTREANDGRGPADFKISRGSKDKSLVEMKLASNTQLQRNLKNQTAIYEKASDASHSIKIIIYFSAAERRRVDRILKRLHRELDTSIVLIDARKDNKPSGSKA